MTKMNLLFEGWRKYLNEGMMQVSNLPENVGILINTENSPTEISISYAELQTGGASQSPKGEVRIGPVGQDHADWFGACLNAWVVTSANADQGWGPLLYDVAIEWASLRGSGVGLAPDRSIVSDDAYGVWDNYMKNRDDMEMLQLDDPANELTPDEGDNCAQNAAVSAAANRGMEWHQTPISKVYKKKNPTMIKSLQAAGKLVFRDPSDL